MMSKIKEFKDSMSQPVPAWVVILWILCALIGWEIGGRL